MLNFKKYISEEVLPTAMVQNGNFDVRNEEVRANINNLLAQITSCSHVTPYCALTKISKTLAYFSVILPKRTYLEGNKGVEVYEMVQFGNKMGMNDQGEFINEVPEKYFLFFQYGQIMGRFTCTAKVVDRAELDRLMDVAEMTMKEDCADDKATASQRAAGAEPIQPETASTKKASAETDRKSNKKLSADKLEEEKKKVKIKLNPEKEVGFTVHSVGPGRKLSLVKSGTTKVKDIKEDNLDETRMPASVIKHKQKLANMTPEEKAKKFAGKSEQQLKDMARRHGYGKDSDVYSKHVKEETLDEISAMALKSYKTAAKADRKKSKYMLKKASKGLYLLGRRDDDQLERSIKNRKAGIKLAKKKLDEVSVGKLVAYRRGAEQELGDIKHFKKHPGQYPAATSDDIKSAGHREKTREKGIKLAHKKMTGKAKVGASAPKHPYMEETISEKAPPGAKFERMVKHIKAGYSKDGLTKKEKGIAFATAWKAKNKEK